AGMYVRCRSVAPALMGIFYQSLPPSNTRMRMVLVGWDRGATNAKGTAHEPESEQARNGHQDDPRLQPGWRVPGHRPEVRETRYLGDLSQRRREREPVKRQPHQAAAVAHGVEQGRHEDPQ